MVPKGFYTCRFYRALFRVTKIVLQRCFYKGPTRLFLLLKRKGFGFWALGFMTFSESRVEQGLGFRIAS